MENSRLRSPKHFMFPIVLLAVLVLGVSVATAANSIEGAWSFNGGTSGSSPLQ